MHFVLRILFLNGPAQVDLVYLFAINLYFSVIIITGIAEARLLQRLPRAAVERVLAQGLGNVYSSDSLNLVIHLLLLHFLGNSTFKSILIRGARQ